MVTPITVWTKPVCVQCNAVKRRLVEKFTGKTSLDPKQVAIEFALLVGSGKVVEEGLTLPENEKHLSYFKGLGYTAAPLTEYKSSVIPGYSPDELDKLIDKWKEDND